MGTQPNTFIIAEGGVNHNGSLGLALELVSAAKACGADAVKFQTFHLIDAVLNLTPARPVSVTPLASRHQSLEITLDDGTLFQLDALGDVEPCFRLDLFGTERISSHAVRDNFSMFRRLLYHFARSVREGRPAVPPADTVAAIKLLIAGRLALAEVRAVSIDDITL